MRARKFGRVGVHRLEDEVDCTGRFLTPIEATRQVVGETLTEQRRACALRGCMDRVGSKPWPNNLPALRVNSSWVARGTDAGSLRNSSVTAAPLRIGWRSNPPTIWPVLARSGAGEAVVAAADADPIQAGFDT